MEVIPISAPDSMGVFRDTRVRTFFIVDDRLDEAKLRDALTRLIRDHWRKLGARIVQRKDGKLEYHVPEVFADDYELFRMSREDSDQPFAKAAASLDLNSATREGGVTVLPGVEVADALFRPSTWPQLLSQAPDTPLLLIHLSLFADATVITTSVPHVLGDQLGLANIIKAWLGLVENKTPPPWVGYNEDILPGQKPFSEYPRSEMFKRGRVRVRYPLERFFVLLLFIWELITEPKEAHHILFFPTPLVDSLRERHSKPPSPADKDADAPKLTNGDILTAIMTKVFLPPSPTHTLIPTSTLTPLLPTALPPPPNLTPNHLPLPNNQPPRPPPAPHRPPSPSRLHPQRPGLQHGPLPLPPRHPPGRDSPPQPPGRRRRRPRPGPDRRPPRRPPRAGAPGPGPARLRAVRGVVSHD